MEITQLEYESPKTSFKLYVADLTIQDHAITTLIGPNGSGKSTFLNLLNGKIRPSKGTMTYQNLQLNMLTPKQKGKIIGYMPQHQNFPEYLSVKEIVKMGRLPYRNFSLSMKEEDNVAVEQALHDCQLIELKNLSYGSLSGGQKQRVRLAVVLAQQPDYIFLDEPTTYLDIHHQYLFLNRLRILQKERNFTVVMVLHDVQQALIFSDYWIGMKDGKILFQSEPCEEQIDQVEELFSWPFIKTKIENQLVIVPKERREK